MTKELSEKEEERIRKLRDDFVDEVDSVSGDDEEALKKLVKAAKKYEKKRMKPLFMKPTRRQNSHNIPNEELEYSDPEYNHGE